MEKLIQVKFTNAADCMVEFDQEELNQARGIRFVRRWARGAVMEGSPEAMRKLREEFQMRQGSGWDYDNPGAAATTARGAVRAIDEALKKAGV